MITAGEVLRKKRESLNKSLDLVSSDTKIQKRFLEYIESNKYDKFDSQVFASGFIKIYAKYLGLDIEKLLALYRRSNPKKIVIEKEENLKIQKKRKSKLSITPKIIAIATLIVSLLIIFGYIGYQIYQFRRPPELNIIEPVNGITTQNDQIIIKGTTDIDSTVKINDILIETDSSGYFEYLFTLTPGENNLKIVSKKDGISNLENAMSLQVTYENSGVEPETEGDKKDQTYTVVLTVFDTSAWVKLDLDQKNVISQVVESDTKKEYTFKNKLSLTTGKVQNTKIIINGEEKKISSSQTTGIGQLECNVKNNEIICN